MAVKLAKATDRTYVIAEYDHLTVSGTAISEGPDFINIEIDRVTGTDTGWVFDHTPLHGKILSFYKSDCDIYRTSVAPADAVIMPCGHGEIHRSNATGDCLRCS